jgi:hypothetical protein
VLYSLDRLLVHGNCLRRNGFPAEDVDGATAACGTEAVQFERRVEQFAQHVHEVVDVTGCN